MSVLPFPQGGIWSRCLQGGVLAVVFSVRSGRVAGKDLASDRLETQLGW